MKNFLFIFAFFLFISCAGNKNISLKENLKEENIAPKDTLAKVQDDFNSVFKQIDLPFWFYNNSSCKDYSICISEFSYYKEKMLKQALEDVSVQIARNIACYIVDKKAKTKNKYNENLYEDKVEFALQVADSSALQKVKNHNLHLIAEEKLGDYYLTFYSFNKNQELKKDTSQILEKIPNVFIEKENSSIFAYAEYEASDLKLAYENAIYLARLRLAHYLEKEIFSNKINIEEKKFAKNYSKYKLAFSEETTKHLKNFVLEKINIKKSKKKYKVLVKMKLNI